jgi:hypothetical protein
MSIFIYVTITTEQNVLRCSVYTALCISNNSITSPHAVGGLKDFFSCLRFVPVDDVLSVLRQVAVKEA